MYLVQIFGLGVIISISLGSFLMEGGLLFVIIIHWENLRVGVWTSDILVHWLILLMSVLFLSRLYTFGGTEGIPQMFTVILP